MSLFDPIKPYLTLIKLLGFLACVVVAFSYGCSKGKEDGEAAIRDTEVKQAKEQAKAADDLRIAAEAQAERYRTRAESQAAEAQKYQEALNHENRKADKLAADLRSGDVRFRKLWASCQTVSAPGQATPGGSESDGEADDRAASASRIVRAAAACDAQVTSLQNILREERTIR